MHITHGPRAHAAREGRRRTVAKLDLLKERTNLALPRRIELSERDTKDVVAALGKWTKQFNAKKAEDAHHLMGLWMHQQHNARNEELLKACWNLR